MSAVGLTPDSDPLFGAVIVRDLPGGTTQTVSRPSGTAPQVDAGSFNEGASVSADGRYVAFATNSQGLLHGVPDGVVVRDMVTGTVTLVAARTARTALRCPAVRSTSRRSAPTGTGSRSRLPPTASAVPPRSTCVTSRLGGPTSPAAPTA